MEVRRRLGGGWLGGFGPPSGGSPESSVSRGMSRGAVGSGDSDLKVSRNFLGARLDLILKDWRRRRSRRRLDGFQYVALFCCFWNPLRGGLAVGKQRMMMLQRFARASPGDPRG